jgi:DNA adenine methylase
MKYAGSKRTIAKYIVPFLLKDIKNDTTFIDIFCGGCNIVENMNGKRIANDINKYLIAFYKEFVYGNFEIPVNISREEYLHMKHNKDEYPKELIGFVGVNFSYRAKWFSGFDDGLREGRMYASGPCAKRLLDNQKKYLKGIEFLNKDYREVETGTNNIIYCDPPYEGTEDKIYCKCKPFVKNEFIEWCKYQAKKGNKIFISEYSMPEEFKCVIELNHTKSLGDLKGTKTTEKLFVLE